MTDLIVHHLDHSRSQRLLWLLEELDLPYELRVYQRNRGSRAPDALKEIHPLGKSPVLQHGDVVLAESGAIVEHVLDELADGRLRPPPGTAAHRDYRFWLHFAEGSMMSPLLVKLIFDRLRGAVPILGRVIANKVDDAFTLGEIHAHLAHVERTLEDREWLAGQVRRAGLTAPGRRHGSLRPRESLRRPHRGPPGLAARAREGRPGPPRVTAQHSRLSPFSAATR